MAREVRRYTVTIPAGTALASPQVTALVMPARTVRSILWRVPPGPRGLMGFQVGASGVQVIPWNTGEWIVADDESDELPLEGQITSGAWQCIGYNTGRYDHAVYLTFYLDPPPRSAGGVVGTIPPDAIGGGSGGGGSTGGGGTGGGSGGGGGAPIDPGSPPPGSTPDYAAGWAAARHNAIVAIATALGLADVPDPVERPAAGSDAADGYDDGRAAALVALGDLEAPLPAELPPGGDGAAIARQRALAAIQAALGGPWPDPAPLPPAPGTDERAEYDAGKAAILAALEDL